MDALLWTSEEVGRRARALYQSQIRQEVETASNVGRMVFIDVATGAFAVDDLGFDAAIALRAKNPHARLFGLRIGFTAAASLGGVLERAAS